ncbi:DUF4233 domain-containing protein [Solwaraspora sp. WMMD406]|uniref:DUF4233 domain-containing protein n=1 Tax=Solwaraspora sp. WMMD406 TaxID=3016095 RepID=UPI002417D9AE|nr:DUF4233 domain-containing protein [Solwaraspora sp. WMMD406]MDG4764800.1 DUF4233 domain-containing protein [Solwaraspora sp. WMMD406]
MSGPPADGPVRGSPEPKGRGGEGADARPAGGGPVESGPAGSGRPVGPRRSGLRNPVAAARGLGAATLGLEALVLVLAVQPIRVLSAGFGTAAVVASVALAVGAIVVAGLLGRAWAWYAGTVLQALVLLAGLLHWSLLAVGVLFALVWGYVWHVRRVILS